MTRDTTEGKTNFLNVRFGPMFRRWAEHLTKGRVKYPDASPGTPNWTLAAGVEEYLRAKESAARHFEAWLNGERDEDHAAGVYFNINLAEYVLEQIDAIDPGLGAKVIGDGTQTEPPEEYRVAAADEVSCEHMGPDGWFCERPLGHAGLHWFPVEKYSSALADGASPTWP